MLTTILLIIGLILCLMLGWFWISQAYGVMFKHFSPFVSTKNEALDKIVSEITLEKGKVYELGSGKANFLRKLEKKSIYLDLIGIEKMFFPFFLSHLLAVFTGSRVMVLRQDIFDTDLQDADLIYCYLLPTILARLSKKFREECKPGTLVYSLDFQVPDLALVKEVDLGPATRNDKLYIYQI